MTRDKNTWEQAKTAYAAGIGLRELARNMGIPEGTVLARANREGWTQQIQTAKNEAQSAQSNAITPMQSAAATMHQRGERHVGRIADISDRVVTHVEAMQPATILESIHEVEKFDRMARRNYGLSDSSGAGGSLSIAVLTNQVAVTVSQN